MRQALTSLEGVASAQVSFDEGRAEVTYRLEQVEPEQLVEAVERVGFEAELAAGPDDAGTTDDRRGDPGGDR